MKKRFSLSFVFSFLSLLLMPLVSAQSFTVRSVMEDVVRALVDIFEPLLLALFGDFNTGNFLLFEKLLLFIILVVLINVVVSRVPYFSETKGVKWVIAIVIPLIAVRFIDYEQLNALILQYEVLGVVLLALLPLLLFFFFLYNTEDSSAFLRKTSWIFFIGIYIGLWTTSTLPLSPLIFGLTLFVAFVMLIFDNTIYGNYWLARMKNEGNFDKHREIAKINEEMREIAGMMRVGDLPDKVGNKRLKKLEKIREKIVKGV